MAPIGETKPRGPIAAMYSSPGPCYLLPGLVGREKHDPRSVHNRGPAWPLLGRHGADTNDCSPGPKYMVPEKTYNTGRVTAHQYTLKGRCKEWSLYANPGPGAYSVETAGNQYYRRPPAYSINGRHDELKTDSGPGPNHYNPDPMLGKTVRSNKASAPNHSLKGRSKIGGFHEDLQKTPGPGSYAVTSPDVYKTRSPKSTMTSRNPMPGDNTRKPGPDAYFPERMARNGGCSFGIKHSQYSGTYVDTKDIE